MTALLATLAALAAAPLLDRALPPAVLRRADVLLRVVVVALLLVDVLPGAMQAAGAWALGAAAGGLLTAVVAHRAGLDADTAGRAGVVALAIHGVADGVALAVGHHSALGAAVVLHTLPLSLVTWRVGRAAVGAGFATRLLVAAGTGTVLGYAFFVPVAGSVLSLLQAASVGLLLAASLHGVRDG